MTHQDNNTEPSAEATFGKTLRPALIASRRILTEYSTPLRHLLAGLADESIPTVLICPARCDVGSIVPPTVEVIQHPAFEVPLTGYYNRKILLERLAKLQTNILHCLCESKAYFTRWLSRQMAVPYVIMVNSLQKRWPRLSVSSRRCARIIVPARTIADSLNATRHKLAKRIEQINVGTFTSRGVICFADTNRVAGVVIAARLGNVRDFENLFGALRHLAIDGHEFMIVLTGTGRAQKPLWKLLSGLGMLQMVTFIPEWQNADALLAAGDIFIRPKPSNAFNPLLLEAMSAGAAVAACTGGVDDLIIADQTALTFDSEDELSIYNCLRRLFDRKEMARKLGRNAQRYLKENHTVTRMVADTLGIYSDARQWFKD